MNACGGHCDVLKVKSLLQPRKLQGWQAYHTLTYASKWKPHVDEVWKTYKEKWQSKHPTEKPQKTWLEIMVEVIRAKFSEEDEDMKKCCEEYWKPEMQALLNPKKVKPQGAIMKLSNRECHCQICNDLGNWLPDSKGNWYASLYAHNHRWITHETNRVEYYHPCRWAYVVFSSPVKSSFSPSKPTGNRNWSRPFQIFRDRNRTLKNRSQLVHNPKKTSPDRLRPVFCFKIYCTK